MYELILKRSLGRTGNCMICIMNAIKYAMENHIDKISFEDMNWMGPSLLPKGPNKNAAIFTSYEINIDPSDFKGDKPSESNLGRRGCVTKIGDGKISSWFVGFYTAETSFEDRMHICKKYLKPLFDFTAQQLGEKDLVIHLRSGDIMGKGHYGYLQPPLSFYIKIIELKSWDNIYILTERDNNPCFRELIKRYPSIITFLDSGKRCPGEGFGFKHDLGYLVGCQNYAVCQSSLCPLIIQLSDSIKNVYIPSYMLKTDGKYGLREHPIWWSKDFMNKKDVYEYCGKTYNIYDYDKYSDTNENIHEYEKTENIKNLLEYGIHDMNLKKLDD
tara:strand:- start:12504 stop:13490 length:987 start_codon:yes stop_codon:yes gene_type:complete